MTRLPLIEPGTADTTIEDLFGTARRQIGGTWRTSTPGRDLLSPRAASRTADSGRLRRNVNDPEGASGQIADYDRAPSVSVGFALMCRSSCSASPRY